MVSDVAYAAKVLMFHRDKYLVRMPPLALS
jgi:hypothetical protein